MALPEEERKLLLANKALVVELLRLHHRAFPGVENAVTDALFKQLGVVEWWLQAADSPMPPGQRKFVEGWVAEMTVNLANGFDYKPRLH